MNLLERYIKRVSNEDAEPEVVEPTPEEVVVNEVVEEAELEVPAVAEDITEDQVEEAVSEADEAKEELDIIAEETSETAGAQAEVEEELASIEEFAAVLSHGIKTKTYSPQFAAVCQAKLAKLHDVFGEPCKISLEDFGGESLDQYYTASLESFMGFFKRVADINERINDFLPNLIRTGKMVKGYTSRAQAVHAIVDGLSGKFNELAGDVKYSGTVQKTLTGGGDNFMGALNNDLKLTSAAVTKGLVANEKLLGSVLSVLNKAITEGGKGKTGAIVAEAGKIQPATAAYPEAAFSTGFLGGKKLAKSELTAGEGADIRTALKVLAGGAIPSVVKGSSDKMDVSLSKADIGNVIKLAKVFAELGLKAAQTTGEKALEQQKNLRATKDRVYGKPLVIGTRFAGGANATTWSEGKDLDALASAFPKILNAHVEVYRFLTDHAISVAENLAALAERAIKKAAPAAAE